MILEVDDKIGNMIIDTLFKPNNTVDYKVYGSAFDCFLNSELKECRDVYQDTFGEYTLKQIEEEVESELMNEEIDMVTSYYFEKVQEYAEMLDSPTIGSYVISNNIVVNLKSILDDEVICTYGNDVYKSEIAIDEEGNFCAKIDELLIPLQDFVRVQ